jgi:hypothetical protein
MLKVRCNVFHSKWEILPDKEGNYRCEHCGGKITVKNGKIDHENYTLDNKCELLKKGLQDKELILVHGFGNKANKNYSKWVEQCVTLGWSGNIRGFQWDSHIGLLGKILVPAASIPHFIYEYHRSRSEAEKEGRYLARIIADAIDNKIEVTILAFSLGCRIVLFALRQLGQWRYRDAVDVHLCAGAVTITESWRIQSSRRIYNYFSPRDRMLSILFKACELGGEAIGSIGLRKGRAKHITNILAVSKDAQPIGHWDYKRYFAQFGLL